MKFLLCILLGIVVQSTSFSQTFSLKPEDQSFLQYYYFTNIFDSSVTVFRFGEVQNSRVSGEVCRVTLADSLPLQGMAQASREQGENFDLRSLALTETFVVQPNDKVSWYSELKSYRSPCDPYSGDSPNRPRKEWAMLDQTEFVTELVDARTHVRLVMLDSIGVMPPDSNNSMATDTRYGTQPARVVKTYTVPSNLEGRLVYLRVSPRRWGSTPLGMILRKVRHWVAYSSFYDSTGIYPISPGQYKNLSQQYYDSFLTFCDSVKIATGWLPHLADYPVDDSITKIVQTRYLTPHTDSVTGNVYWVERTGSSTSKQPVTASLLIDKRTRTNVDTRRIPSAEIRKVQVIGRYRLVVTFKGVSWDQQCRLRVVAITGEYLSTIWSGLLYSGQVTCEANLPGSIGRGSYFLVLEDTAGQRISSCKFILD